MPRTGRARARVGVRARERRAGGGEAGDSRRRGRPVRRGCRDDVDCSGARRRPGSHEREHLRAGSRADRTAGRLLRRRSLPRGAHARAGARPRGPRDPAGPAPGGRVAIAVWGPRERNPWLGVVLDAVSAQIGKPVPPPGIPGPFSLDDADELAGVLVGRRARRTWPSASPTPLRAGSFEEWWTRTSDLAGPLAKVLASLPEPATQALRARLHEAVRPYETPAGLEFPGVTLLAVARRA